MAIRREDIQAQKELLKGLTDLSKSVADLNDSFTGRRGGPGASRPGATAARDAISSLPFGFGASTVQGIAATGGPLGTVAAGAIGGAARGGIPGAVVGAATGLFQAASGFAQDRRQAILNTPFGASPERIQEEVESIRKSKGAELRQEMRNMEGLLRPFKFFDQDQGAMDERKIREEAAKRVFIRDGAVDSVSGRLGGERLSPETLKQILNVEMRRKEAEWNNKMELQKYANQSYGADTQVQGGRAGK